MRRAVDLDWGRERLHLLLPREADVLRLRETAPLADPAAAVRNALERPIGAPPLRDLIMAKRRRGRAIRAVVVVSDRTRPVPYRGAEGLLEPVLETLRRAGGVRIAVLVATGTHRPLNEGELRAMLCPSAFDRDVTLVQHVADDEASLCRLGRTERGTDVWINRRYVEADLKILTGLVEPHFMAGVSGGRKSICPGLAGERVTHVFHGAAFMADPRADSLVLEGNPCHEEALAVARMAGADFNVNATLNRRLRLTGVFAGDLVAAHEAATRRALATAAVPIAHRYDAVVTHAGFVGINHYQAAKAAVEAVKALRPGGTLILAANHTDVDPVGSARYASLLPMLRDLGPDAFEARLRSPGWRFVPDQWELQMWARALRRLGRPSNLIYCSPQLTGETFRRRGLFGTDGGADLDGLEGGDLAQAMVQRAVDRFLADHPGGEVAVLADGPYGVPRLDAPSPAPAGEE